MMGHLAHFFQRRNTILVIQAGAILLLISSVFTWVRVSGPDGDLTLSGAEMATLVRTIGVVGVGAGVLITLARRWVRGVLAAVVLGGGVIALIAAVLALIDPGAAAAPALSRIGAVGEDFVTGFGLWAGLAGGLTLIVGSLGALLFSPSWEDEQEEHR